MDGVTVSVSSVIQVGRKAPGDIGKWDECSCVSLQIPKCVLVLPHTTHLPGETYITTIRYKD